MHWLIFVVLKTIFVFGFILSLQLTIFRDSDIFHNVSEMPQFFIILVPLVFDEWTIKINLRRLCYGQSNAIRKQLILLFFFLL